MMIKVSNEFLDFDETIEVEKQIKLFEEISTTDGDFSYAFNLPKTIHNTRLLNNPFPDNISKPVYQQIPAELLGDSGAELYKGYLRIERIAKVYECSFFAGNNNWFAMISGHLSELDFSAYDVLQTQANIIASWTQTEGIVFPLVDNAGLLTRSAPEVKIEDFIGAFYVKTIFAKIFNEAGIKIQGELLEDWRYQNMVCMATARGQSEIDARSTYAHKTDNQSFPNTTETDVTYDNDFDTPYFDGSQNNFNLGTYEYTADVKMIVKVDSSLTYVQDSTFGRFTQYIKVNGAVVRTKYVTAIEDIVITNAMSEKDILLEAGDVLQIRVFQTIGGGSTGTILSGSLKVTPTYLYFTSGAAAVPNWTSQQFVSNVLRMFNVLSSYNAGDATLTLNLFEKLKSKTAVDLSEYLGDIEVDYTEFISDYAKSSKLSYKEVEFEDLKAYNKGKIFKYGQGVIEIENDFLEDEDTILESDFCNPVDYVNAVFDCSLGKTNLIELQTGDEVTFDDVADDGTGRAAFHISSEIFQIGDLVRIYDSSSPGYNGDYIVDAIPAGHVVFDSIPFEAAATGKIVKLNYEYSSDENVFVFINIPNYQVSKFSDTPIFFDDGTEITSMALVYFDMIDTGKPINTDFIYSLAFGRIDDPLAYQVPLVETHFRSFGQMLNDPVKLIIEAHIPYSVFVRLDFLKPITIKTLESSNQYYLNKISGYQESYRPCQIELIKLASSAIERYVESVDAPEIPSGFGFPYIFDFELS
jgi:hypothetical protein